MFIGHYGVAFAAKPVGVRLEARDTLDVSLTAQLVKVSQLASCLSLLAPRIG